MPALKLLLIDPLTLLGHELESLLPRYPTLARDVHHLHTGGEDEHQVAELGGAPVLVPPLTSTEDLEGFDAIVVASEVDSPRLARLDAYLPLHPEVTVLVLGRGPHLFAQARPATGLAASGPPTGLVRVAHPAVVAAASVVEPLRHLAPVSVSLAAVEPVSFFGGDAVEALALQAGRRLQGASVDETVGGLTLAFNLVALECSDLTDEAVTVLSDLTVTATRAVAGFFHGHLVHLVVGFARPCSAAEVEAAWNASPDLNVAEPPMALTDVTETDRVAVTRPRLADGGTTLAVTAMVDGLRVGGAVTAARILSAVG